MSPDSPNSRAPQSPESGALDVGDCVVAVRERSHAAARDGGLECVQSVLAALVILAPLRPVFETETHIILYIPNLCVQTWIYQLAVVTTVHHTSIY